MSTLRSTTVCADSVRAADLVIVSNRLPVRRVREQGRDEWKRSPGGLVSALTPVLARRGGLWIGWAGQHDAEAPETHDGMALSSVKLSRDDVRGYYHGFSNSSLWPLYHDAIRPPEFERRWWSSYAQVNERFARAAAERAPEGSTVWVHDYHLHLMPALLRRLRPDLTIGFFLHIPFPPPELFAQLPWRTELLAGLLGADLVGFHTTSYADNFKRACRYVAGCRPCGSGVLHGGRLVRLGGFPISIDTAALEKSARSPWTRRCAARLRTKLGPGRRIVLGVDRLDYTKGIEHRLRAYLKLLDEKRVRPDQCVLVQVAVPSRELIRDYADQRAAVERLVGEINGRHGDAGRGAVHYLYRSLPFDQLVAYYGAADVMAVTPLRDGMNLVAKEYVASRVHDDGVLMLSEFTGAAEELSQAHIVNPHDLDGLADTLESCLNADPLVARSKMHAMREHVRKNDVQSWAARFLSALEQSVAPSLRNAASAGEMAGAARLASS